MVMLDLLISGYATKGEAVIHPGEQIDSKVGLGFESGVLDV